MILLYGRRLFWGGGGGGGSDPGMPVPLVLPSWPSCSFGQLEMRALTFCISVPVMGVYQDRRGEGGESMTVGLPDSARRRGGGGG